MAEFNFKTVADLVAHLNQQGVPLDQAKFEISFNHATYIDTNKSVDAHDAVWFVGVNTGWASETLVELEDFNLEKIHWSGLEVFDTNNNQVPAFGEEWFTVLERFKNTGDIEGFFFRKVGFPYEDEDDARTWGPQSPAGVDWSGFSGFRGNR